MNNFKKIVPFFVFFFFVVAFLFPVTSVWAQNQQSSDNSPSQTQNTTNKPSTFTLQNPLKVDSLGGLIQALVEVFTYLVVLFAVLSLVYVGLRYIMARGNSEEITKRTNQLLWIVIGLAVVIGARIIVGVVINTLDSSGVVDPGVIKSVNDARYGR